MMTRSQRRNRNGEMPRAPAVPALGWFREHRAEAISAQGIERRFQQQEWSPATANRYRALLSLTYLRLELIPLLTPASLRNQKP